MILDLSALNEYVIGLAKALYTRGFDLPANPSGVRDASGKLRFTIRGVLRDDAGGHAEIVLAEIWSQVRDRFARQEYAYDLIDRPRNRRRAFHQHNGFLRRLVAVRVHEHCEEVLDRPACDHYLGHELPNGYLGLDLLIAAWVEPDRLGCGDLRCLG